MVCDRTSHAILIFLEGMIVAKKKAKSVEAGNGFPDETADIDALFSRVVSDVEQKRGKRGVVVSSLSDELCVLPVPSVAMRYLLQSTGWMLSRLSEIVGPEAVFKSTLAIEILRWHALCQGRGVVLEAETKPTPDLRNAVLHYQTNCIKVEPCNSLEEWQRCAFDYVKRMRHACSLKAGPGPNIPFAVIVDSFMGKACEGTIKKVRETGAAQRDFPAEANLIKTWMQVFMDELVGWPFSLIGVNHVKPFTDPKTSLPSRNIPGGKAIAYYESLQIELAIAVQLKQKSDRTVTQVRMTTHKNTYGERKKSIIVPLNFWTVRDESGIDRLYARWEWWEATVNLLTGAGMSAAQQSVFLPRVQSVLDIKEVSAGNKGKIYWSNKLGVTKTDGLCAHDFGVLLETRCDVLYELYSVLGIAHRPFFQPAVEYLSKRAGYEHVATQADMSRQLWDKHLTTEKPPVIEAVENSEPEYVLE